MKRGTFLKVMVSLAFVSLLASVGFGQILTDYQDVAETSYQTAGADFRLYVEPDPVYSPTYDAATNANLGATARWTWTYDAALTGDVASGAAVAQNYVEFTNPVAGAYTMTVVESNTLAGCIDATPSSQDVTVIAAPTMAVTTADPAEACDNQAAMAVALSFTESVPFGLAGYAFAINETVENIDPAGATLATLTDNDSFVDFPTNGKLNSGSASPLVDGGTPNFTWSFNTSALNVQNSLRTRYTYTLIKASNAAAAAADGVISAISHKSDWLTIDGGGDVTTYAFGDNQIVIIVNPTPNTGEIFHIPNSWAY